MSQVSGDLGQPCSNPSSLCYKSTLFLGEKSKQKTKNPFTCNLGTEECICTSLSSHSSLDSLETTRICSRKPLTFSELRFLPLHKAVKNSMHVPYGEYLVPSNTLIFLYPRKMSRTIIAEQPYNKKKNRKKYFSKSAKRQSIQGI